MQITLQTSPKGSFYASRFDRYRKNVIENLKESVVVPGRRYDARTMSWMIPATAHSKAQIDKLTYYVRHFEPIMRGDVQPETVEKTFDIPELPSLDIEHGLKIEPYE